ncbi:hypothetical protein QBC44DRAFT_402406 [Cladorrhinum sp. PSN332]|nr:hypothetical protein QBC44DRAFT_402406 [Cladorrhinum sp. PSN332]
MRLASRLAGLLFQRAGLPSPARRRATSVGHPRSTNPADIANSYAGPSSSFALVPYNTNAEIIERATFFRPMECRAHRRITEVEAYDLMIKGFSPNYKGNRTSSATGPPKSQRAKTDGSSPKGFLHNLARYALP